MTYLFCLIFLLTSKQILSFDKWWKQIALVVASWTPHVAGQLFFWQLHVKLFCFVLKERLDLSTASFLVFSVFVVDFAAWSVVCTGMAQTLWLMDASLIVIRWSISVPTCLLDFDAIRSNSSNPSSPHDSTPLGPLSEYDPSLLLSHGPSKQHYSARTEKGRDLSDAASLCLLNLRASTDFHWERKENLNTNCFSPPPLFLTLYHSVLFEGQESLQLRRLHATGVLPLIQVGVLLRFFSVWKASIKKRRVKKQKSQYMCRDFLLNVMVTLCCNRCEFYYFWPQLHATCYCVIENPVCFFDREKNPHAA